MSRCELSGLSPVVKNLVSHSNIKTKSRAHPNIQNRTFYSATLKRSFKAKVSTRVLRNIDKVGGVELYILKQSKKNLSPRVARIQTALLSRMKKEKTSSKGVSNEAQN